MRYLLLSAATAALLTGTAPVLAQTSGAVQLQSGQASGAGQSGGGVAIGGDVRMNTSVGSSVTQAIGSGAEAKVDIGSVKGGTAVGGDLNMNTNVGSQYTTARGSNTKAHTSIGSVRSRD